MFSLPQPLHPAIVHFPIAFIVLGTACAVIAVVVRRWHLPALAAILLGLGALGAIAAEQSGEREEDAAKQVAGGRGLLKSHETWAERTRNLALVAATLAIGAGAGSRWPRAARSLGAAAAMIAAGSAWCVVQTGHAGGQLVYRHGAGVTAMSPGSVAARSAQSGDDHSRRIRGEHR